MPVRESVGYEVKLARFNPPVSWLYKTYVAMFASVLRREDTMGLLDGIVEEPCLGNPLLVRYRGRYISQDLCNSVHEFYRLVEHFLPHGPKGPLVAELGAGYGRLAFVCLRALSKVRYCIIDLPPALYLAQWYLTTLFPDMRVFRFREFGSFDEVRQEFMAAQILFLIPCQMELLPPKTFGCFINISSLHEMTMEQVRNYFLQIDRLTSGIFYTKQWRVSRAKSNGYVIGEHDYPVPPHWEVLFHRRHPVSRMFFEAMYRIPGCVSS